MIFAVWDGFMSLASESIKTCNLFYFLNLNLFSEVNSNLMTQ